MGDHLKLHEHITDIGNTVTYWMIFLWFLGWILYCLYYSKCRKHTVANSIEDGNIIELESMFDINETGSNEVRYPCRITLEPDDCTDTDRQMFCATTPDYSDAAKL